MARPKKNLGESKVKVVDENVLLENPEGLPYESQIVIAETDVIPEMRKVHFVNGRDPGFPLEFHYKSKTHPLKQYKLCHGFQYLLPVEVIDHLESCAERQYAYRKGMDGHPEMYVKGLKYLYQCRTVKAA